MNRKKKSKTKHSAARRAPSTSHRMTSRIPAMPVDWKGEPDQLEGDDRPDKNSPLGVREGRGPLNEEGEADRQNDQLAELQSDVDSRKDLEDRR